MFDQRILRNLRFTCFVVVGVGPEGKRSVLARVSIVDFFGRCLLDNIVRVEERVTDYRTNISGLTSEDLASKRAVPFAVCRKQVIRILRHKVLVGHGLENDLAALGIVHPWYQIRDTATYHPFQSVNHMGRPCSRKLRDLTRSHLGLIIQVQGSPHCPIEDACAAMALYRSRQAEWDCDVDCRRRGMMGHNSSPAFYAHSGPAPSRFHFSSY